MCGKFGGNWLSGSISPTSEPFATWTQSSCSACFNAFGWTTIKNRTAPEGDLQATWPCQWLLQAIKLLPGLFAPRLSSECVICVGSAPGQASPCSGHSSGGVKGLKVNKQTKTQGSRTLCAQWAHGVFMRHMQMFDNTTRRCLQSICQSLCLSFVSQFRQLLRNVKTFHSTLGHKSCQVPVRDPVAKKESQRKGKHFGRGRPIKQQQAAALGQHCVHILERFIDWADSHNHETCRTLPIIPPTLALRRSFLAKLFLCSALVEFAMF